MREEQSGLTPRVGQKSVLEFRCQERCKLATLHVLEGSVLSAPKPNWSGVYCDLTTQFDEKGQLDPDATAELAKELAACGVTGLVVLGEIGEARALRLPERLELLEIVTGSCPEVPVVSVIDDATPQDAAKAAEISHRYGACGIVVRPHSSGWPSGALMLSCVEAISLSCTLPVAVVHNWYRTDCPDLDIYYELASNSAVEAVLDSGPSLRTFDLQAEFDDRFAIMAGSDELAFDALLLGASGWVSGLANAFPSEILACFDRVFWGSVSEAHEMYCTMRPLIRLLCGKDKVEVIKIASAMAGRGTEHVRSGEPLSPERRSQLLDAVSALAPSSAAPLATSRDGQGRSAPT